MIDFNEKDVELERRVFTPEEVGRLIPKSYQVWQDEIIDLRAKPRIDSEFLDGKIHQVLDAPPILATPYSTPDGQDWYALLLGNEQACAAFEGHINLKAYIIGQQRDLRKLGWKYFVAMERDESAVVWDAFPFLKIYINICRYRLSDHGYPENHHGIFTVTDLVVYGRRKSYRQDSQNLAISKPL